MTLGDINEQYYYYNFTLTYSIFTNLNDYDKGYEQSINLSSSCKYNIYVCDDLMFIKSIDILLDVAFIICHNIDASHDLPQRGDFSTPIFHDAPWAEYLQIQPYFTAKEISYWILLGIDSCILNYKIQIKPHPSPLFPLQLWDIVAILLPFPSE